MTYIHSFRNACTVAALLFFGSLLPGAAFMNEVWHLEGYIASGNTTSAGTLTRIHGTVKFTADQIQFSTNIGNFTRQAPLEGMNYYNERKEGQHIVENTRAQLTSVDQSTFVLNYASMILPFQLFKSYECIGAVLTRRAVSSRLFPFDEQSVELWLQPDRYEGSGIVFKSSAFSISINTFNQSEQITIGGSPISGFFMEDEDEKIQLHSPSNLNEFHDNFLEEIRTLVETFPHYDVSGKLVAKTDIYQLIDWGVTRYIHLGDGRLFWFSVDARIRESFLTELETGSIHSYDRWIEDSEMECGVLEQKLWFESSFNAQAAPMASPTLQDARANVATTAASPKRNVALVKVLHGEAYEVSDGIQRPLKLDDWISEGSVVKTGEKSFVKLIFLDKSMMNMGSNSEMKVERYSVDDAAVIDRVKGYIRSKATKDYLRIQENKSKLFIKTSNCVHGVRGTEFELTYNEENGIGTTALQMIEGSVEFTNLITGVTSLVSNQDSIVAQGPINGGGIAGPEITVLDPALQSLTSGALQSMGVVVPPASSESVVFRIRNIGQTALTGVKPVIRGVHAADFSITQLPEETLSPITGEGILRIVFTPSAPGLRQAVLEIPSSDANENPFVVNLEGSDSPFAAWSGGTSFGADANGDGVDNGLAFLLGAANPGANALALIPAATHENGNLKLTFGMLNADNRRVASLSVEYSGSLGNSDPWIAAQVPDTTGIVNGVNFIVNQGNPHNSVTAIIPVSGARSGRLFYRLKAME